MASPLAVILRFVVCALVALVSGGGTVGLAQDYPERPVEFIVPWSPGGGSDTLMRIVAEHLEDPLRASVPVINMPGVSGTLGLKEASRRPGNGYTIAQIHDGLLVSHHTGLTDLNWDTFVPVASITASPQFLVVHKDTPYQTLEELVAYAKENPGEIRVGVTLAGVPHLHAAMIEEATGIQFSYVGFEGTGERIRNLVGQHIDAAIGDVASSGAFVESGELRFLAVGSPERLPQAPDVPTLKELGYDLELTILRGVVVPEGTPEASIATLADALEQVAGDPDAVAALEAAGAAVAYRRGDVYSAYLTQLDETIARLIGRLEG
ncbi:MAG: Bug family tripartite tricarboxylate transporter substrate binding protein [Candidatus Competibacterales bacterium]